MAAPAAAAAAGPTLAAAAQQTPWDHLLVAAQRAASDAIV